MRKPHNAIFINKASDFVMFRCTSQLDFGYNPTVMSDQNIPVGPFNLLNVVGRGGMGEVWRAVHREHGSLVAVKVISAKRAHQSNMAKGFFREARAMAGLNHPNIIHMFDYGKINEEAVSASAGSLTLGTPYLAMDLADNGTLSQLRGKLDWQDLRFVIFSLLDALAHAHARGVIHKDLKPGNVLLKGVRRRVMLTDFGLSHVVETEESSTDTPWEAFGGTPAYMAPEQFYGDNRELGPWTDLYSLGCLIYTLLTKEPPFGKKNWVEVANGHMYKPIPAIETPFELPNGFMDWLRVLMAKAPVDRFECAADAAFALSGINERNDSRSAARPRGDDVTLPMPIKDKGAGDAQGIADLTTLVWLDEVTYRDGAPVGRRVHGGEITGSTGYGVAVMPNSWRRPRPIAPNVKLTGTGLNLFPVRAIPMVGRQQERSVLWEALRQTRQGGGVRVVLLSGPAGLGASRLARWLGLRAAEVGAASVLSASHGPVSSRRDGLQGMTARHLRVFAYPRHEVASRLRKTLLEPDLIDESEWLALTDFVAPAAKVLAGRDVEEPQMISQARRFELVRNILRRASHRRPVLLLLDDVHYSTEAVEFVLDLLGRREAEHLPVLVVMTANDGDVSTQPLTRAAFRAMEGMPDFRRVHLQPLSDAEQGEFIDRLLPLDGPLKNRLMARTAGNPQFAHQLLGDWVDRGLLVVGADGFTIKDGVNVSLPDSLQEVWRDTVNRLLLRRSPDDAIALELAAVLGHEVDAVEWRTACEMIRVRPSPDLLEVMFEYRLARSPQGPGFAWSFVHGMLRETLEIRAEEAGRLQKHHLVCAKLLAATNSESHRERRAWHLLGAGAYRESLPLFLEAATLHMGAGDTRAAHACLDARDRALRAIDPEELHPDWASGWVLWCSLWRIREDFEKARSYGKRAIRLAKELELHDLLYRGYRELGVIFILCGVPDQALKLQERAIRSARMAKSASGEMDATAEQGWIWLHRGDLERSAACFNTAAESFEAMGLANSAFGCWLGLAEVSRMSGDYKLAHSYLTKVVFEEDIPGSRWILAARMHAQANLARSEGRLEAADAYMFEAGRLYAESGSAGVRVANLNRGYLMIAKGDFKAGMSMLEGLFPSVPKDRIPLRIQVRCGLLVCAAHFGDWLKWDHHLSAVSRLLDAADYVDVDVAIHLLQAGEIAVSAGEVRRGRAALLLSKGLFTALGRADLSDAVAELLAAH